MPLPKLQPLRPRKPSFPPTLEQEHILSLLQTTKSNLLINALAGSGKTSTLELIQSTAPGPILCLAFNKRIADEMATRFVSTTMVKTLNGLGHGIWASACGGRLSIPMKDKRCVKMTDILSTHIKALPRSEQSEAWEIYWDVLSAVGLAKNLGYIPDGKFTNVKRLIDAEAFFAQLDERPSALFQELTNETLTASIRAAYAGSIDFNDQVYMSALFGGTYPKFPLVLVDEAQDLSPVNHRMLEHLSKSRIIAVGDPYQSIYGFRGAVRGGMSKLKERFEMTEADLSVSFRCPEAIVANARWRVPHMTAFKQGGSVEYLETLTPPAFPDGCAIICRNNAPLFALALRLLAFGRRVSVSGSDIGPRIIAMLRKLGGDDSSQAQVLIAIDNWLSAKLAKDSKTATDLAECMRVFALAGRNLREAIGYAEHLFKQEGSITLLTGHKAKGLEWPTVFHMNSYLLGPDEQDLNLRYVIQTRAMERYVEFESGSVRWD